MFPLSAWFSGFVTKIVAAPLLAIVNQCAPAIKDMRPENMKVFNRNYPDVAGIRYFSVGAKFKPWPVHFYLYVCLLFCETRNSSDG